MSSPGVGKRRMDTDVIKLIESKHEVNILGGLNEFCVKFYGPKESEYEIFLFVYHAQLTFYFAPISSLRGWRLECARASSRELSVQIAQHRFHEQNLSSKY